MTPTPICYTMTRMRRMESGRPATSIWFSTTTPMAVSVCCAAKPRARNLGPSNYPPAKPGALECWPLKAAGQVADAACEV